MSEDAVWAVIDHERLSLADLLEDLSAEEWVHPSLCSGWRVCDVAAHLALAHTGPARVALGMVQARGNFARMIADTARRHATGSQRQVTTEIRAMAGSRRRAAGVSYLEPLVDVLVHGQDIAVPLGRARPMPVEAAATAATRVWTMPWPLSTAFQARARLSGLELVATDIDWSVGEGARVEGPIEALLLLLTGRMAGLGKLSGTGVGRLSPAGR
ncbi:maleylpyruvate isomerase family mycothiol-dependent enzyme [Jatrophihabitans sp.]|uniref:maleylpyruvate isomerase family mycothiol-dependent enzyme n=1 Tax=Jatrophihabitans sp. TaxID=1932789 RepID=UPI002C4E9C5B|nr:maleylpyruvate isomerase family mycothiol-dependent enzyme [Jatrophihabitans sp.]